MATPLRPRGNIPSTPLCWSLDAASFEFAMSATTLRKLLNQASIAPGEDGCYSTTQLLSGVYGRMHEEKLRTQEQLTKKYELANRTAEGNLLDWAALMQGFSQLADALVNVVMTDRNLTRESKEDFLRNLGSWPVILDNVVRNQSKLKRQTRRSKNGQDDKDGDEG
jgi:hypothetical protein